MFSNWSFWEIVIGYTPHMLMVIFGAGASFDSAQAFPLSQPLYSGLDSAGPWRPPLAANLFRDPNHAFGHIVQRYPKLSHILPYLRDPPKGRSVEEELEFLQTQAHGNPERARQFASVTYYLRDLLFEVSNQWRDRTSGVTNYAPLIDEILQHNKGDEPTCLVTFNYDLLLDRALESFDYHPQSPHDQFKAHPILKLFKPHGSVNWARFVDLNPDTRLLPQHLIERAETIQLTDEFVTISGVDPASSFPRGRTVFPVIAIPFQNKTQDTFVWPPSHLTHFLELLPVVTKLLIIGWQAREAHFMQLLRSNLPRLRHLMVVGRDSSDAEQTLSNFEVEIRKAFNPDSRYVGQGGFTQFVVNPEGQSFLEA